MPSSPASQDAAIHRFFEEAFQERLHRSPQSMTALGINRDQDRLDDLSDAKLSDDHELIAEQLQRLEGFDFTKLSPSNRLNYRLFQNEAGLKLKRFPFRFHEYTVTQKFGLHTDFPAFMINMHRIASVQDAHNYLARLQAVRKAGLQVMDAMQQRAALGIIPPAFLLPQIIDDCKRFLGEANDPSLERNSLYVDFRNKLAVLHIDETYRADMLQRARQVLLNDVLPFYQGLATYMESQLPDAPAEGGASRLPDGAAYYHLCLERHTSTSMTADEIFELGCRQVRDLQEEILALQTQLGRRGSLQELFEFARDHPEFHYPQTEAGRQACLRDLHAYVEKISPLLPGLFGLLPQDALQIKAVEDHRERTAGLAFYEGPAADGSRPGIFYVNLYDLRQLPIFAVEALAYHEALPGHHLQFSIANRLQGLPLFRRYVDYTAYIEGWGLYSERLAKESGLYQDPWSDFGRLTQELKRACRLVVDSGLHAKAWTREQAIAYMHNNTPSSLGQVIKEVDRYIVMPGQATSYKVGMEKILGLREAAQTSLADSFRLSAFHDELLRHGPLPLGLLEEQVKAWADGLH